MSADWQALEKIAEEVGLVPDALPLFVEAVARGYDSRILDSLFHVARAEQGAAAMITVALEARRNLAELYRTGALPDRRASDRRQGERREEK